MILTLGDLWQRITDLEGELEGLRARPEGINDLEAGITDFHEMDVLRRVRNERDIAHRKGLDEAYTLLEDARAVAQRSGSWAVADGYAVTMDAIRDAAK